MTIRSLTTHLMLISAALLASCGGTVEQRGNLLKPDKIDQVQTGVHSKEEVADILGSPSIIGTFDDNKWYYVATKTAKVAFLDPDVLDHQIVVITFDKDGIVNSLSKHEGEPDRDVQMVERTTPTAGQGITVIEQLLGNIGRFNKEK